MDNKLARWLFGAWMVLAIATFVCAFYVSPLIAKILMLAFGAENMLIIISSAIAYIDDIRQARKQKKLEGEGDGLSM